MTTTTATLARRIAEARWALAAAIDVAGDLPPDVAIGSGHLEIARDELRDPLEALDLELRDVEDVTPPRPWRQSAAAWHTPAEVVEATERILETAGGMLAHSSNRDRGKRPLGELLEELATDVDRHRRFPLGFDVSLLVHRTLTIALELELRGAGSAEALEAYGVTLEDHDA